MTRTRRLLGGVSLGYVYLALVSVVGLWLTPFLLSHISRHDFGLWLVATQLQGYLQLTDFGLASILPRDVALASGMALGERGSGAMELATTLRAYRRIVAGQMVLVIAASVAAWLLLPTRWDELSMPLLIVLVAFVVAFPLRLRQGALQGLQDHSFVSKLQIGSWAAGTGLTIAMVLAGSGLVSLAAGWALTHVLMLGGCALRVRHAFPDTWRLASRSPAAMPDIGVRIRRMGWLSLSQLGHVLLNGTDMLVLGALLGPSAVVAYACTGKLVTVLTNYPQLVIQTAVPALAELRMASGRDRLVDVIRALLAAMLLMSGGIITVILAVNASFVEWWVGEYLFAGTHLTVALASAMLFRHVGAVLNLSLFPFGYEQRLSMTALADGVLTLLVTAALVQFTSIGVLAAPIGSIAGAALITVPASLRALGRELQTGAVALIAPILGWIWRFLAFAVPVAFLGYYVATPALTGLVAGTLLVMAGYVAGMVSFALQPPLGLYVRGLFRPAAGLLPRWAQKGA